MIKMLIPLCVKSTDIYHLNILMIIEIIYHIYIEWELNNLAYNKNTGVIYGHEFIRSEMGERDDHDTVKSYIGTESFY